MRLRPQSFLAIFLGILTGANFSPHLSEVVPLVILSIFLALIFYKNDCLLFYLIPLIVAPLFIWMPSLLKSSTATVRGIIIEVKTNYVIVQSLFQRYYLYSYNNSYQIGDFIEITGSCSELNFATYESRFDFNDYLNNKGVFYQISSTDIEYLFKFPLRFRTFEEDFLNNFDENTKSILDSVLFNRKDYSSSTISYANSIGLISLISTSGLFFGLLLRLIENVLSTFLSDSKSTSIATIVGFVLFPIFISKVGIFKTLLVRLIKIINSKKKIFNYIDILSISGIIILVLNIYFARQSAFLLSFGVSFLLFISSYLFKRKNQFVRKIYRYFFLQLFLLPVSLSYSNGIHVFSPLINLILLPIAECFSIISLLSYLTFPFTHLLNFFGSIFSVLFSLFSKSDLYLTLGLTDHFCFIYYCVFFICLYIHEIGDLHFRNIIVAAAVSIFGLSYIPLVPIVTKQVSFINVGQGDCCLIRDGINTVMIDTGGITSFDIAEECLIPYLIKNRIYKIDYLIGTHSDFDHIGAVDSLRENFNVKNYIDSADDFPLKIGDISLTNYNIYEASETNDTSIVLGMDFIGYKWLFMADASTTIEKEIINDNPNLKCDILKLGHHGSSTSSCLEFLEAVDPSVAIISVGASNKYGHPTEEVLNRLEKLNITIRRTDIEGTITYIKPFFA